MTRRGTSRATPVLNDRTGEPVGRHIDHWDGRRDAVATHVEAQVHPGLRATPKENPA